jgi:hypothetical protein
MSDLRLAIICLPNDVITKAMGELEYPGPRTILVVVGRWNRLPNFENKMSNLFLFV